MSTFDPNFRASTSRSISVFGELDDDLISRVGGEVLRLREDSSQPISVFTNSPGGTLRSLAHLYALLTARAPSGRPPRLITVAIGSAHSAAASLLSLGDYAISYPKSSIHFHGVRFDAVREVTMESASIMAAELQAHNRATAMRLATAGANRLAFHYAVLKRSFGKETEPSESKRSAIECFALRLKERLSATGDVIVDKALKRWRVLQEISKEVLPKVLHSGKEGIEFEAEVLRCIIDFEVSRNSALGPGEVYQIALDYLLLRDYYLKAPRSRIVSEIGQRYPRIFLDNGVEVEQLSVEQSSGSAQKPMTEKLNGRVLPFCFFAESIWQALQEEENPLSPKDAYWLGAVDEVYDSGLPCVREIMERDEVKQSQLPLAESKEAEPKAP